MKQQRHLIRRVVPGFDPLEPRTLLSATGRHATIFDADSGITSGHGSEMYRIGTDAIARAGIPVDFISLDTSLDDGLIHQSRLVSQLATVRQFVKKHPYEETYVAMPFSGSDDGTGTAYLPLENAIGQLASVGVVVIVAAGNKSLNLDVTPQYPANIKYSGNVITVGAVDEDGDLRSYSNFGTRTVDVGVGVDVGWGTSGASVFASVIASDIGRSHPRGPMSGRSYAKSLVKAVVRSATVDPSLSGYVHGGRLLTIPVR